jgi:alpha-L-fucosidase 2
MPLRLSRRSFLAAAGTAPLTQGAEPRPESGLRLWYRQPAPDWNEALPIGNGRLGAMVFGGVSADRLQLNENTLYSDEPGRRDLTLDITRDFDRVVDMLRRGGYAEADAIISHNWCGRAQACYQPLGDLHLYFEGHAAPTGYQRDLDLRTAISTVRYTHAG